MPVRWARPAAGDLERIARRIRRDNPAAARQVARLLYDRCMGLELFPERGRPGRITGTRELVFAPFPYIAVYRITGEVVEILRIYHSAQDWP
jgi:addiction module RelE/StbE family toxin